MRAKSGSLRRTPIRSKGEHNTLLLAFDACSESSGGHWPQQFEFVGQFIQAAINPGPDGQGKKQRENFPHWNCVEGASSVLAGVVKWWQGQVTSGVMELH